MALSKTRRAVNLALATLLLGGGVALTAYLLLWGDNFRGWMLMGAAFCAVAGACWIYADYIDQGAEEA